VRKLIFDECGTLLFRTEMSR